MGALARWTAEPVKHVWLPAGSFIPNAKGYPVLSKACQAFLKGMCKVRLRGTSAVSPQGVLRATQATR